MLDGKLVSLTILPAFEDVSHVDNFFWAFVLQNNLKRLGEREEGIISANDNCRRDLRLKLDPLEKKLLSDKRRRGLAKIVEDMRDMAVTEEYYSKDKEFFEKLRIRNVGDIKIVVQDPDVQIRVLHGEEAIDGNPPEEAERKISVASFKGKVKVDYRPANKQQVDTDITEDEREMAEVLAEVEKVLDSRVDLNTLKELRADIARVNAPEVFMTHMQMLGNKIAEKEEELEKQQFAAALRLDLPPHLIDRGIDIVHDMVGERKLSSEDELLIRMLNNLRDTYKEEAREEDGKEEVAESDTSSLIRRLKRLGRRKKDLSSEDNEESNFRPSGIAFDHDKYKVRGLTLFGGDMFSFTVKTGQAVEGLRLFRDKSDKKKYRIVGDIEELTAKGKYQVEVEGNVQKIEAHDDAVVEVEGKVVAAVTLDSSEVYASGRIKRKRQFGESVIREYDSNLERYE